MSTVVNFPGSFVDPSLAQAIDKTVHDAYHYATREALAEATQAALRVVRQGGTFLQAMDEAEATIYANGYHQCERIVNGERVSVLMFPGRDHVHGLRERYRLAAESIRERLRDSAPDVINAALDRARRVIDGNGTVAAGVYFGLGEPLNDPGAA